MADLQDDIQNLVQSFREALDVMSDSTKGFSQGFQNISNVGRQSGFSNRNSADFLFNDSRRGQGGSGGGGGTGGIRGDLAEFSSTTDLLKRTLNEVGRFSQTRVSPERVNGIIGEGTGASRGLFNFDRFAELNENFRQIATAGDEFRSPGNRVGDDVGILQAFEREIQSAQESVRNFRLDDEIAQSLEKSLGLSKGTIEQFGANLSRQSVNSLEVMKSQVEEALVSSFEFAGGQDGKAGRLNRNIRSNLGLSPGEVVPYDDFTQTAGRRLDVSSKYNEFTDNLRTEFQTQFANIAPEIGTAFKEVNRNRNVEFRAGIKNQQLLAVTQGLEQRRSDIISGRVAPEGDATPEEATSILSESINQINRQRIGTNRTVGSIANLGHRANEQITEFINLNKQESIGSFANFNINSSGAEFGSFRRQVSDPNLLGRLGEDLKQNINNIENAFKGFLTGGSLESVRTFVNQADGFIQELGQRSKSLQQEIDAPTTSAERRRQLQLEQTDVESRRRFIQEQQQSASRLATVIQDPSQLTTLERFKVGTAEPIGRSVTDFLNFNLRNLQFSLIFGISQALFASVTQFPQESAQQSIEPIFQGIGNLTGIAPLFQALQGFSQNIPQFIDQVSSNINTLQSISGDRQFAEEGISRALEISRIEPIQFNEALSTIRSFTVFPETRPFINDETFQKQTFETVQLLRQLAPEQGTEGAIFAIRELLGGQERSLQRRFNIDPDIIAQQAGATSREFDNASGDEIIRILNRGLRNIFGGEEILLRAGAQLDTQINNVVDTLVSSIVVPLATERSEPIQNIIGSLFERDEEGRTPFYQLRPELRPRLEDIAEERGEPESAVAQDIFGTPTGLISLLVGGLNNAFEQVFQASNFNDQIGQLFVDIFTNLGDPIEGFLNEIEFAEGEGNKRNITQKFGRNLTQGIENSFGDVSEFLDESGLRSLTSNVSSLVRQGMFLAFQPIIEEMFKGTIAVMSELPAKGAEFATSIVPYVTGGVTDYFSGLATGGQTARNFGGSALTLARYGLTLGAGVQSLRIAQTPGSGIRDLGRRGLPIIGLGALASGVGDIQTSVETGNISNINSDTARNLALGAGLTFSGSNIDSITRPLTNRFSRLGNTVSFLNNNLAQTTFGRFQSNASTVITDARFSNREDAIPIRRADGGGTTNIIPSAFRTSRFLGSAGVGFGVGILSEGLKLLTQRDEVDRNDILQAGIGTFGGILGGVIGGLATRGNVGGIAIGGALGQNLFSNIGRTLFQDEPTRAPIFEDFFNNLGTSISGTRERISRDLEREVNLNLRDPDRQFNFPRIGQFGIPQPNDFRSTRETPFIEGINQGIIDRFESGYQGVATIGDRTQLALTQSLRNQLGNLTGVNVTSETLASLGLNQNREEETEEQARIRRALGIDRNQNTTPTPVITPEKIKLSEIFDNERIDRTIATVDSSLGISKQINEALNRFANSDRTRGDFQRFESDVRDITNLSQGQLIDLERDLENTSGAIGRDEFEANNINFENVIRQFTSSAESMAILDNSVKSLNASMNEIESSVRESIPAINRQVSESTFSDPYNIQALLPTLSNTPADIGSLKRRAETVEEQFQKAIPQSISDLSNINRIGLGYGVLSGGEAIEGQIRLAEGIDKAVRERGGKLPAGLLDNPQQLGQLAFGYLNSPNLTLGDFIERLSPSVQSAREGILNTPESILKNFDALANPQSIDVTGRNREGSVSDTLSNIEQIRNANIGTIIAQGGISIVDKSSG